MLSGFSEAKKKGELYKHDVKQKRTTKSIRVPIVLMENYGSEIAIDDKHIKGRYYTIISNIKTGKIIIMARTVKSKELYEVVCKHFTIKQMMEVRVVTKDAAESYDWLSRQAFPNAVKVLDKWHILKWAFDALQSFRNELKNKWILSNMAAQRKLNIQYQIDLKAAKKEGTKISKRDYKMVPNIYSNGDDEKQLLTRSRYLLYKYEDQWNTNQEIRADLLFKKYPELMDAYVLILKFRDWYSQINIGESRGKLEGVLMDWIIAIRKINTNYFRALATSIKRHRGQILNYFIGGYTNASAEALNRNLKRFIGVNYGIRNLNFFYFRLNLLHASTSI